MKKGLQLFKVLGVVFLFSAAFFINSLNCFAYAITYPVISQGASSYTFSAPGIYSGEILNGSSYTFTLNSNYAKVAYSSPNGSFIRITGPLGSDSRLYTSGSMDFDVPLTAGTYSISFTTDGLSKIFTFTSLDNNELYWESASDKVEDLGTSGNPETVKFNEGDSLPLAIMKTLAENPNVSFEFKFVYEEKEHTVLIPAGKAEYDESIPWYGPLWLINKYGEYNPDANHGTYIIQKGDTLNALSARFGVSVDDLMKLNPYIKNKNKIYPGNKLEY